MSVPIVRRVYMVQILPRGPEDRGFDEDSFRKGRVNYHWGTKTIGSGL